MKIGSRPIATIARTGELTPPGSRCAARANSSPERVSVSDAVTAPGSAVPPLPVLELVREVEEPDLLELCRGVERRALGDAGLLGDRVEHRVALLLAATVRHREDRVGPVLVGRALVAVRDAAHRGHAAADVVDLLVGHLPDTHPVRREA